MSCSFWLLRKRKAAMKRKLEAEQIAEQAEPIEEQAEPIGEQVTEPAEKKPVKKAVKADDPKAD